MFRFKKILCVVAFFSYFILFPVVSMNTVLAVENIQLHFDNISESHNYQPIYLSNITNNYISAIKNFLSCYYLNFKPKFVFDQEKGYTFRAPFLEDNYANNYYRAILKQIIENKLYGSELEAAVCLSRILTDVGLENYFIYITDVTETNSQDSVIPTGHFANLYKLDDNWLVADALFEKELNDPIYLNLPFENYEKFLIDSCDSNNQIISVLSINPYEPINKFRKIKINDFFEFQKTHKLTISKFKNTLNNTFFY